MPSKSSVMFFNKKLIEEYKPDSHYTLVPDGKWTVERDIEAFGKVYALTHSDDYFADPGDGQGTVTLDIISAEKALFVGGARYAVEKMRDYKFDFGIVPFPKLNEAQVDYRVSVLRTFTLAAIPITAKDPEMSEIILEALACEGYNEIVPAYYEVALKNKYARDTETVEMLDIISTSSRFDFTDCCYSDIIAQYARGSSEGLAS